MLASLEHSLQQAADALSGGASSAQQQQQQQQQQHAHPPQQQLDADAANAAMQTLLAGMALGGSYPSDLSVADGGIGGSAGGASSPTRRADGLWGALRRDAPTMVLWFGRVLGVLVQQTQLVRLLAAALVAYAAVAGLLVPSSPDDNGGSGSHAPTATTIVALRPALVLFATQLAVLAASVLLLGRRAARRVAERDGQSASGDGIQLPMRLRQFDVLSYMPGAREALAGLSGYRQLANGLWEDAAVYLLACGLLSLAARAGG